jgi:hypothetical protein
MKYLLFILSLLLPFISNSQDFEMDDTVKLINKPTNSSTPPHDYFQFTNHSGDSLPIRWKVNQALTYYTPQWSISLQDNEAYHNPIIDSNDIMLPDTAGSLDKIIISVFHNGIAGYGELVIDLINLDSIQEVHQIKFEINIYPAPTISVSEIVEDNFVRIFPNPATNKISFELSTEFNKAEIFNLMGLKMGEIRKKSSIDSNEFTIQHLTNGSYFIRFSFDEMELGTVPFMKQ